MNDPVQAALEEWRRLDAEYKAEPTPERERAALSAWYRWWHLHNAEDVA